MQESVGKWRFVAIVMAGLLIFAIAVIYKQQVALGQLGQDAREAKWTREIIKTARAQGRFDTEEGRKALGTEMVQWAEAFPVEQRTVSPRR